MRKHCAAAGGAAGVSTEVMTSTIMGPIGAAASEARAVKDIVELGGTAAAATKVGIPGDECSSTSRGVN